MSNKEIATYFSDLADVMELHEENPFKIRSYQNAYVQLRKLPTPLTEMQAGEIASIKGVGEAIAAKIQEILKTGQMQTLDGYYAKTPDGIRDMLQISGFGPKKVRVVWKELGAETIGELLYACNENRLVELKGFGPKTQDELRKQLEYFQKSRDKFLFAHLEPEAHELLEKLRAAWPSAQIEMVGEIRRLCPVVERMEILVGSEDGHFFETDFAPFLSGLTYEEGILSGKTPNDYPANIHVCKSGEFGSKLFKLTGSREFLDAFVAKNPGIDFKNLETEQAVFEKSGLPFLLPELRESSRFFQKGIPPDLIQVADIQGVVHSHTTWSDGNASVRQMAEYARSLGFGYIAITDHSKSAFYANGLKEDRLLLQWEEINKLNLELAPFRIFKGIESDILADGSLDYPEEILSQFDCIIASVHANLKMDLEKATTRLIRAIENPRTHILGHPTGRLLLSRAGYPIDHQKVIDACAANRVSIELNANPYRLDLDWTWIAYAMEKGVPVSINPDAHSLQGIHDIRYGVLAARKGGLTKNACLNSRSAEEFARFLGGRAEKN